MSHRKTLCIEGWRHINHSYALVNQWQILSLLHMPINIRHRDADYYDKRWNPDTNSSGFSPGQHIAINSVPPPKEKERIDVTYRIKYPPDFSMPETGDLFVFSTAESKYSDYNGDTLRDNCRIITPSKWSKNVIARAGVPSEKIRVIPHGIDPETFYPANFDERNKLREFLGFSDDDFVLLSLGAMTDNKGIDYLLHAFSALRKRIKSLKLILKDQSNLYGITGQSVLHALKERHGIIMNEEDISSIRFLSENVNTRLLRLLYSSSDCYVSPYRAEGFNLTPLEAAACGVRIIVTKGGSTDDYFTSTLGDQVDSQLMTEGDSTWLNPSIESLIHCIEKAYNSPKRGPSNELASHVRDNHNWNLVTKNLANELGLFDTL